MPTEIQHMFLLLPVASSTSTVSCGVACPSKAAEYILLLGSMLSYNHDRECKVVFNVV